MNELRRRMEEVIVSDRTVSTEALRAVLRSDMMTLLKNYMDVLDADVDIALGADDKVHVNVHIVCDGIYDTGRLAD